ncbi:MULTISPECIES: cyclase family protein [Methylobacterium]|uniref:cyclase family protein n=1 Tax=Methylobacterium TaxID=407 RepID=UPI0008A75089|nr:cyclase family protein [Methylobacterium sp. 275MFSha3.1]SEH98912.1 Putative cyclase [Methylobacterium sp. 275MFSha3.1]
MTLRWTRRPECSTWGDFGPDDELGRLNLLTPEKVLQGVAEVREGVTFCLSLPLDLPGGNVLNPRRHPPQITPTRRANGRPNMNFPVCEEVDGATDVICDDRALIHLQYSTQWDSLAHVGSLFDADGAGAAPTFYNGFRGGRDIVGPSAPEAADEPSRAKRLGIERLAETGMQGRAVMIDLRAHLGDARTRVGYDELARILEADGVVVEPGDMVCLHTGFAERLIAMGGAPDPKLVHTLCAGLDGRDPRLLDWITRTGLCALIADNYAVEAYPAGPGPACCATLPLHEHCLFKLGVNLGELWHLTPLADWLRARGRSRFLLTAPPLRLPGAVGSPTTPIATV